MNDLCTESEILCILFYYIVLHPILELNVMYNQRFLCHLDLHICNLFGEHETIHAPLQLK